MELKVGDRVVYKGKHSLQTGHIVKMIKGERNFNDFYVIDNYSGYVYWNEILKYPEDCKFYEDENLVKKKYRKKNYNYLFLIFKKNEWITLKSLKFNETDKFDLSLRLQEEFPEIRYWNNNLYVLKTSYNLQQKCYQSVFRHLCFDMRKVKFEVKPNDWVKVWDHEEEKMEWKINSITDYDEINRCTGKDIKYLLAELKLNCFRRNYGWDDISEYFNGLYKELNLEVYYKVKTDLCSNGDEVLI